MAPRGSSRRHHFTWEIIRWSELHGYAGVERALGAGIIARTRSQGTGGAGRMVEAELVLPVAIGHPDVDEVRILFAHEGLAGVEGQSDRFAVELGLGRRAAAEASKGLVLISFWSVPPRTAANGKELQVLGQEAEIHVVVGLDRPGRIVIRVSVRQTGHSWNPASAALDKGVVVDFLVRQRRYVEVALIG